MPSKQGREQTKAADYLTGQIDEAILIAEASRVSAMIIDRAARMPVDELISTVLKESVRLTQSRLGFFGTYEPHRVSLSGITWFGDGNYAEKVERLPDSIDFSNSGLWVDYIRRKESMILNSHNSDLFPEGHISFLRYLFVPVIKDNEIIHIIGLADKEIDYKPSDNNLVSLLWDTALTEINRKEIERRLERAEESFELAVKEAGLGVWDYDAAERKMVMLKGFSNFIPETGFNNTVTADEWLGLIHPDDRDVVSENFRAHLMGETDEYRNEYRVMGRGDDYRWTQIIGRAVERDENGVARRIVGVIVDIDRTKRLAQEVENSKNWLQTIIDNIESLLFVKDRDGRYIFINKSFTSAFGFTPEEAIGKTTSDLGLKLNRVSAEADILVVEDGIARTFEQTLRHKDGSERRYLTSKIPIFDPSGNVYALVGLAIDITRMKSLENQLRDNMLRLEAAITGTGNGLWDWNLKDDTLILNDNWFEMIGYSRSMLEKKYSSFGYDVFADLVHPEDMVMVQEELRKHFNGEKEYYRIEIRLRTADNRWKWVLAAGKVFERDNDGTPVRMVGIHTDIDYRIRMEEQLKEAKIKAEESDRLKSSFLANMSHEIRTPMNGIIGFLDLLESSDLDPEQRSEYMSIVRKSSNQLLNIVNDIIDISKIEAGQVKLNESPVDLGDLLDELIANHTSLISGGRIKFSASLLIHKERKRIYADQTKLMQILTNLVSNAVKFTAEGSVTVSCEEKNGDIRFSVKDTGCGIEQNQLDKIFERFRQADTGFARKQEGTGLGLSISKAYIEKMGGRIWVESEPGKGSTFFFTIPAHIVPGENNDQVTGAGLTRSDGRTILVVEDEMYNYMLVERLLQGQGYDVIRAEDGDSAINIISSVSSIRLVLMDIRLPGIDGYETTRKIKKIMPHLPVVALTALALSGDREKALEAGCNDYLKKPVQKDKLMKIVNQFTS